MSEQSVGDTCRSPREQPVILVTGAAGQVGFEAVRALEGLGTVIALDRSRLDLGRLDQVRDLVRETKPALIVNAAAYTAVDRAETDVETARLINADLPRVLAEETARLDALLIHYSTDYVFDGSKDGFYTESDEPNPLNVYGRTKLAGERAIVQAGGKNLVFRTSWVYGTRGTNFLLTMRSLAARQAPLRVVSDQLGAPTWSSTLADLTVSVVQQVLARDPDDMAWWSAHAGVYHMCAGGETTWAGFAEAIFAVLGTSPKPEVIPVSSDEYPSPVERPRNSRLSTARLEQVFGLCPPHWREALEACSRCFAERPD
ncbi:dTDP-4-dehydrorhamnose reductase [Paraburkholderia dokdonensis]|uniref:dTDP-4-dehydrorhamnose reductase n=1 Tax=Paraburkholderia dokdonensis TaxID=2211211 RepID=UPI00101A89A5|nr:dTDP-4-dehydrorhamnose reductase [Paraburkholderia dokdonensis]